MPLCVRCKRHFYRQTWDSPAESCDCGRNQPRSDRWAEMADDREPTDDALEERRAQRFVDTNAQPEPLA